MKITTKYLYHFGLICEECQDLLITKFEPGMFKEKPSLTRIVSSKFSVRFSPAKVSSIEESRKQYWNEERYK